MKLLYLLAYFCLAGSVALTWGSVAALVNDILGIYIGLCLFVGGMVVFILADRRYENRKD